MTPPFRLDDLLGTKTTDGKPPQKKKAASEGYALDELLAPDSTAPAAPAPAAPGPPNYEGAPAPTGPAGDVTLGGSPTPATPPIVDPTHTPAGWRGLVDRARPTISTAIDDFLAVPDFNAPRDPNAPGYLSGRPNKQEETRTAAEIVDWRTPAEKLTATRRSLDATIDQRPDATSVLPSGSAQADAAAAATREARTTQERQKFTPEGWRDVAKRGMQYTAKLYADAQALRDAGDEHGYTEKKREADTANKQSYNAQLLADGAANADTFGAIALSNLLGIVHDPFAGEKRNMQEIAGKGSTFSPDEQKSKLGKNLPQPMSREMDLSDPRDTVAPLVGGLPVFMAGGAVGRGALGAIADLGVDADLLAAGRAPEIMGPNVRLPMHTRIADALAREAETTGIYGPKQAGLAGVREAAGNFVENVPTLVKRGLVQGQGTGAVMAAREAQQTGGDPLEAAVGSVLANAPLGVLGEVVGGALTRFGPVADRSIAGALDRVYGKIDEMRGVDPALRERSRRLGPTAPVDRRALGAADQGAAEAGKLPVSDKTLEGQHQTIAEALDSILAKKMDAENFGGDESPIVRDPSYMEPRRPAPDVPLRSAREVGLERAGVEPVRPAVEANAVEQMFRAADERRAIEEQLRAEEEQARIEQAAAAREAEQRGPKTLGETLAQTGEDAKAGEPLAADYHKAINDFASVSARMKDTAEPGEKLRFDLARARSTLNDMRKKYGIQTGAAAVAALAAADSDLTDEERQSIGLGALAVGSTAIVRHMPEGMRTRAVEAIRTAPDHPRGRNEWLYMLEVNGIQLGDHFSDVNRALHEAALQHGGPNADIPMPVARAIFEHDPATTGLTRTAQGHPETTQRVMDALQKVNTNSFIGDSATPASWAAKLESAGVPMHEAQGVFDALVAEHGTDTIMLPRTAVMNVVAQGIAPSPVAPRGGRFFSRLGKAVEGLEGKKWDEGRPAADWIGKLKGMNTFPKSEFALIESELNAAVQDKRKLTRAEVEALVSNNVPAIERHTLAYDGAPRGDAGAGDVDAITPIEDISPDMGRGELQAQIDHREAAISSIEEGMEERTSEAEEAKNHAESEMDNVYRSMRRDAEKAFPESDVQRALEAATDYLREVVEAEYIPRNAVEKAFNKAVEEGEFYTIDAPKDPEEFNLSVEETEKDGEPWWIFTDDTGETYEGASKQEALHQAELRGAYDNGSADYSLPKGHTIERITNRKHETKWRIITEDGRRIEGKIGDRTPEEALRMVREQYGQGTEVQDITPMGDLPDQWVMKSHEGRVLQTSDVSRDHLTEEYANIHFDPPNSDAALQEIKDDLSRYADAMAEYNRAESEHYWMSEGEAFEQEHSEIEKHRDEIASIEAMMEDAPTYGVARADATDAEETPMDPYLAPIKPRITGKPRFDSYQRIGGGTEYSEYLNIHSNNPGKSFTKGHWSGTPDTVSHVRAESHTIELIPGMTGERIEHLPGEGGNVKLIRDQMIEGRHKRARIEQEQRDLMRQYEALPQATRDEAGGDGYTLAQEYQRLTNDIKNIVEREESLTDRLKSYGVTPEGVKKIRVMLESQADLAQHATEYGVNRPPTAEEQAKYEAAKPAVEEKRRAIAERKEQIDTEMNALENEWRTLSREKQGELDPGDSAGRVSISDKIGDIQDFGAEGRYSAQQVEHDLAKVAEVDPKFAELGRAWSAKMTERMKVLEAGQAAVDAVQALERKYHISHDYNAVPPSPFTETRTAQSLNVARFLLESANRGDETLAWSDAANRVRNAHLPMPAAKLTYDELIPSIVKSLLGSLGFKDVKFDHIYIKGYGHHSFTFTPEMRAAIRKHGLPVMGVLAAMALPRDAEAQDGQPQSSAAKLYGSVLGGAAAGAVIAAMATNKKLRGLVKENRELNRALMIDDLSGLSNKRAHGYAIDSVDRDPTTVWVAFDGDRFKQMNDTYGHPIGDKAIMHFGEVMRAQAEKMGVPMRGFRAGGDEFAMAVPKARASEYLRAVEEASPFRMEQEGKPSVETKLSGAIGTTWGEADALLTQVKNDRRAADPSLVRVVRPEVEAKLTKEIHSALDRMGGTTLYSNPIGPALSLLKRYPSAAAIAVVGMGMTESDNENVRRAGVPVMALAALSAVGSDRILAGKDMLASRLVDQLRKSPEGTKAVRFFNPDALLTPEVRDAIRAFERERAKGVARAAEFSGKAKRLGPEGDRAVSDVLDREDWEDTSAMDAKQLADVLSVAGELSAEYDRLTKEQVAAGTLPPDRVIADYGGPRRYAYWDAMDAMADSPRAGGGGPSRTARIAPTRARSLDIPIREAEAKLAEAQAGGDAAKIADAQSAVDEARAVQMQNRVSLGEIREASYRAASHIEQAHSTVASAKLFETIKNVPGAVHPDWQNAVDEFQTGRDMVKQATTPADRAAAEALRDAAYVKMSEISRRFTKRGGEYVSLPTTPGLGVLSGAVVKRDVAHSLEGFGSPGMYGKLLRGWKELKTVFNPGTSVGNILSNVTALHLGEVPIHLQPYYYTQAIRDLRNYGEGTRALAEAGVLNVNSVNALGTGELGRGMRTEQGLEELLPTTRPETQRVLRQEGITEDAIAMKGWRRRMKGMAAGAVLGAAKTYQPDDPETTATGALVGAGVGALLAGRAGKIARRVYDNEDNIARLAVFLRRRKLGDTVEQARNYAISSLGDFRSRSPALRLVASTVSPFIMYQAKAVPAFAKNMVDHPWKYVSLVAAWAAMNELSKQEVGEVPESDIPVNQRRAYGYFFPGFTQLPIADDRGNKGAVDMARWTPMSGVTTGAPPGSVPEAFGDNGSALVTPGGPVVDAALRASNVDPFSKGPLLKRDRPVSENVAAVAHQAADFVLPSAFGFHAEKLREDVNNADWTKFKNDLLGPTGAKPRYVRPGAVASDAVYTLNSSLRDMRQEFKKALRANKDPDRVRELADQYKKRVATALSNFKSRLGTPPPSELVDQYLSDEP